MPKPNRFCGCSRTVECSCTEIPCLDCAAPLQRDEVKWKTGKTGIDYVIERICASCRSERRRVRYDRERETILARNKEYAARPENAERIRQYQHGYQRSDHRRSYNKNRWDDPDYRESQRNSRLLRIYGITSLEFDALLEAQGNRCAICRSDDPKAKSERFHVDHCHTTGKVRGLLCSPCNIALGGFRDDPVRLRAAALYLEAG